MAKEKTDAYLLWVIGYGDEPLIVSTIWINQYGNGNIFVSSSIFNRIVFKRNAFVFCLPSKEFRRELIVGHAILEDFYVENFRCAPQMYQEDDSINVCFSIYFLKGTLYQLLYKTGMKIKSWSRIRWVKIVQSFIQILP